MVKIYTKTGDKGMTGTFRGRMGKGEQLAGALGTMDELNSWVGLCRAELLNAKFEYRNSKQTINSKFKVQNIDKELRVVQGNLFRIGAILAGAPDKFSGVETKGLEKLIDKLDKDLPPLRNFIYPTGDGAAGYLQVARTTARRAEREVVQLLNSKIEYRNPKQIPIPKSRMELNILKYLNRLSDSLFVMARWTNLGLGGNEEVWG